MLGWKPRRLVRLALLALPLLVGCSSLGELFRLVVPEQRHLQVRDVAQLPAAPLPPVPPPATVTEPPPEIPPENLSLDEAMRVALANSRVVRVLVGVTAVSSAKTVYDTAVTNTTIDEARSVFDPTLTLQNNWNRSEPPFAAFAPNSPLQALIAGTTTDDYSVRLGLAKKNVTGGTLRLDVSNDFARFRPDVFPLNPQDSSAVALTYTQPLLKGAGVAANVAPIVIARINTERSFFQYKDSVQELVRGVAEAYWGIVFARTDVWAKRQQVEQSEFGYRLAEARQRAGLKGGTAAEVAQARTAYSNFKANLIGAEANLLNREAALRNLLGLPPEQPLRFAPTTPELTARLEPRWEEIVKLAGERRPDLIELKLILEADQQALVQAQNQALPQVDTTFLYRWNGLEGVTPAGVRVASGAGQFTDWTLGVNFSVPLGLRQPRAALRRVELLIARDRANLQQGQHAALYDLALTVRNLAQFHAQFKAFEQTRVAARENLDQQLAEFRTGRTIYLNVLQAIGDWGNAVSAEAQALAQYNTELATLERQTGTILETHGVWFSEERYGSIGPLGRLAHPRPYPAAVVPGPNAPHYPVGTEPADRALEKERPANPLRDAPPAQELPPPRLLPPAEAAAPPVLGPPQ